MRKRLFISLLMFKVIFLFVFCTTPTVKEDVKTLYDSTPPTLISVNASYTEGSGGSGDVLIQIQAADDLTYVRSVTCVLGGPTKVELADSYDYHDTRQIDLTLNGNTWETDYHIGNFSENGLWTIDNIQVTDRGYKTRIYYLDPTPLNPADAGKYFEKYLSAFNNPTAFNAATIDRQNSFIPSVLTVDFSPNPLPVPADVVPTTVTIDFDNDDSENIQNVQIELLSPKVRNGEKGPIRIENLTLNGTSWTSSVNFSYYHQSGNWLVNRIEITDNESNTITYYTYDYTDTITKYSYINSESTAVYSSNFDKEFLGINSGSPDILNPELNSIAASLATVSASGGSLNITVYFSDTGGSDMYSVDITLMGPGDDSKTEIVENLTAGTTFYEIPFIFASDDTAGVWTVVATLTDNAGNYRSYVPDVDDTYCYRDTFSGSVTPTDIDIITITKQQ